MASIPESLAAALADRYRIARELGAGGMATVYLAHDLKHERDVAIKVLRPELAAVVGAERFLAEIKTTANLQHPHILSLFDSGTVDGTVFYVMPFVEGESLRDRLAREKQLPVEDALRIGREVADAMQYAHGHGVIHRDIKPENILLQGGHAMVADFGIALAAAKTGGNRMTETGMSLGTPTYMSPEQAMGERTLDARTDVYALACVVYEMLAGEPPFTGPTAQAIVAKVLTEAPSSLRTKRPTVPESVDDAVRIALQKLPADRFGTAAEFGALLTSAGGARRAPDERRARHAATPQRRVAFAAVVAAIAIAAFLLGGRVLGRAQAPPLLFGRATHVTWDPGLEVTPALSPDGRSVAYASGRLLSMRVQVRPVGEGRAVPLTGDTTAEESNPQWSPDGTRVLFLSRGGVFSAPSGGGPARAEIPGDGHTPIASAVWSPDGQRIAFARGDSLFTREADASVHAVAHMSGPTLCVWSPRGTFVACATEGYYYAAPGTLFGNLSPSRIVLCRMRDGALTTVTDSLWLNHSPAWSADERWVYFISNRDGPRDVYGIPIASDGRAAGAFVRLSTGLGAHTISMSANGSRIAFARYTVRTSIWSLPIPTNPPVLTTGATRLTNANEYIEQLAVSPDGKWIVYDSDLTGNADIFRLSLAGGEPERLTTDPTDDFSPVVSPDGKAIAFTRIEAGDGIWIVRRDASGRWGEPVQRRAGGSLPVWSPDGKWLAFVTDPQGGSLLAIPADSGGERMIIDGSTNADATPSVAYWATDGLLYFQRQDKRGNASFWSVSPTGGAPRLLVRHDPALHSSARGTFSVGHGRLYFPSEDRQSDVWVMDVGRP